MPNINVRKHETTPSIPIKKKKIINIVSVHIRTKIGNIIFIITNNGLAILCHMNCHMPSKQYSLIIKFDITGIFVPLSTNIR